MRTMHEAANLLKKKRQDAGTGVAFGNAAKSKPAVSVSNSPESRNQRHQILYKESPMRFKVIPITVAACTVLLLGCEDRPPSPTGPDLDGLSGFRPAFSMSQTPQVAVGTDIVAAELFGARWCLRNGSGGYTCPPGIGGGYTAVATADFNRDGRDDFVLAGKFGVVSQICTRNASDTPPIFTCVSAGLPATVPNEDVETADFNGDNWPDFTLAIAGGAPY